jgi:ubiquinone/menaquinone biosynthesis C-methylase UbiE
MHEHRYHGAVERLRSPERVARLEVERVVTRCLEGIAARSVLDVGTGTGLFAEAFVARGLEVTGIDANPAMIEAAQRLVPQAHFQQATAEEIHQADGAFDLVFLGLILHEADDAQQALREARRLARQRVAVLEWPYQEQEPGPPLADRLRPEQIASLAQEAGFGTVEGLPLSHTVLYRLS